MNNSEKPESGSPNTLGKRISLAVFSIFVGLLVGELAIRFLRAAPQAKVIDIAQEACVYERSTNPVLGFQLKSDYRNDAPDFIESYEFTNSHGQRDVEREAAKLPAQIRVLLLGDSVVEGYGLPFSDTISQQMEKLFLATNQGAKTGANAGVSQVLNFGVSAYCTAAEVELLATKGLQFKPDYVVVVFVENDFDNFNREAFPLGKSVPRPELAEWLFRNSQLCRLTFTQLDWFGFRSELDPVAWNQEAIGENNVAKGLARLRKLADEHQFQPLLAVWPRFEASRIVDPHPIPNSDALIVEALAAQNSIPSFRLSSYFQQELDQQPNSSPRLLFSQGDGLHPTAPGTAVAAKAIHGAIESARTDTDTDSVSSDVASQNVDANELSQAITNVSQRAPNYSRVFNRVGDRLLKEGKLSQAIAQYEKAIAEDPANAGAHNNVGIALERQLTADSARQAVDHYRKAIELEPEFAEAHFNLGNAIKSESSDNAKQHLIRAIQLKPNLVGAHFELSRLLEIEGRMRAAEAGFSQVLLLDGEHTGALRQLASLHAKRQQYAKSRSLFERYTKLKPNDAEALNNLGAICSMLGDREAALQHLKAAVAADPNHPKAAENLRNLQESEP